MLVCDREISNCQRCLKNVIYDNYIYKILVMVIKLHIVDSLFI